MVQIDCKNVGWIKVSVACLKMYPNVMKILFSRAIPFEIKEDVLIDGTTTVLNYKCMCNEFREVESESTVPYYEAIISKLDGTGKDQYKIEFNEIVDERR